VQNRQHTQTELVTNRQLLDGQLNTRKLLLSTDQLLEDIGKIGRIKVVRILDLSMRSNENSNKICVIQHNFDATNISDVLKKFVICGLPHVTLRGPIFQQYDMHAFQSTA